VPTSPTWRCVRCGHVAPSSWPPGTAQLHANVVAPLVHSDRMFVVAGAVWLVGFFLAFSDLLDAIPGRRVQRVIGWVALGSFYVAFKYAPDDAGAVLIEISQKAAKQFTDLFIDRLPRGRNVPTPTTTP